ncbi:MAG: DHA2 family efflux MFS transporter permease subunit [Methanocalculus sp.]|uniref:DHA2 family efflux MFS transporter permease subunit n=1 Tax=Methanocalculus sp. TaxID=2004547 RepID=UPI0027274C1D|nr:DHA2 family efflux MFS transporter permease subunit [Methanocalculus sp.]MDO9539259.1 DHA2 family efflux MFS transporter permease subunit [Methanocalculus sp.]
MHLQNDVSSNRNYTLLLISISLATFMSALDGTIVNIALPTISEIFNLPMASVSWVATIYLLVLTGCVLIFGKLADRIGFKIIFVSGFLIFTIGSFSCGFFPELFNSYGVLIGSRILQAIGGAMIVSIAPALVATYFPMKMKGKALGMITVFAAFGAAVGPIIGGMLTQYLSWNWIFYINVPVGFIAILLGMYSIPATPPVGQTKTAFDSLGAILVFTGIGFLIYTVSQGASIGWTSPQILITAAISAVSLLFLVYHELRTPDPLVDFRLFTKRNFLIANLILVLTYFLFAGVNYILPFFLEIVRAFDTSTSGIIMTCLSGALMISGILSGVMINRFGNRKLCILGSVIVSAGYAMFIFFSKDVSLHYIALTLAVVGFGLGFLISPGTNMVMGMASRDKHGMVSSLINVERFGPMTLGISFVSMLFIQAILAVGTHRNVTTTSPGNLIIDAVSTGFDLVFVVLFALSVIIIALALLSKDEIHPDNLDSDEPVVIGV